MSRCSFSNLSFWAKNTLNLSLIAIVILIFFIPILSGQVGIFLDDVATYAYPNAVFQAKTLQEGIFPFWEPHTFAGAYPFYTRTDSCSFYLPQIVFGLLAPLSSEGDYLFLILIPVIAHYLLAALGAFLLGCLGLGLNRSGSTALALSYALSISLIGGMLNPPALYSQAWLPWLTVATLGFFRNYRVHYLVVGAVVLALQSSVWPIFTFHGLFICLILAVVAIVRMLYQGRFGVAWRLSLLWLGMNIVGLLLSAVFWLSFLDGLEYVQGSYAITQDLLTAGPRSVPLSYWATIFLPELYATVNFSSTWGVARVHEMWLCEAAFSRGFWLLLPAWLAIVSALSPHSRVDKQRVWIFTGVGLVILSLLLMSGRHTPFFSWCYQVCPLFRLPYASRWYTLYTFGLSLLIALGVDQITRFDSGFVITRSRLLGYGLFVVTLVCLSLLSCFSLIPPVPSLSWFITRPGLYGFLSIVILLVLSCWVHPPRAGKFLLMLALADLLYFSLSTAYLPMGITWEKEQNPRKGPWDSELYQSAQAALELVEGKEYRAGFYRSHYDAVVLCQGGLSFLGVGTKPMLPRAFYLLQQICDGFPYQLNIRDYNSPLTSNFSVRDWFLPSSVSPCPDWIACGQVEGSGLYHYQDPAALPRVYTLNRWSYGSPQHQARAILSTDLSRMMWCDQTPGTPAVHSSPASRKDFIRLQQDNKIISIDDDNPNKLKITLKISNPAWLVITDAWHPGWRANDNGKPVLVNRVNYIQRGLWLEEGDHRIEMEFIPWAWRYGRWLMLSGLVGLFLLIWGGKSLLARVRRD